jgi:hypothetical protein
MKEIYYYDIDTKHLIWEWWTGKNIEISEIPILSDKAWNYIHAKWISNG